MDLAGSSHIDEALQRVGQLLAFEGHTYAIVVLGGAALNLLGIVERPTSDVDILAFARPEPGQPQELQKPPEPMPQPLVRAIRMVARDMSLEEDWLNAGPALQWRAGLPPGLARRISWRQYAALWVGLVGRYDLIFFKLFATADSASPQSIHYQDLLALAPRTNELEAAAAWVRSQDVSPEFARVLDQVLTHVRRDLGLNDSRHAGRAR